jgi:hypothetical protein
MYSHMLIFYLLLVLYHFHAIPNVSIYRPFVAEKGLLVGSKWVSTCLQVVRCLAVCRKSFPVKYLRLDGQCENVQEMPLADGPAAPPQNAISEHQRWYTTWELGIETHTIHHVKVF